MKTKSPKQTQPVRFEHTVGTFLIALMVTFGSGLISPNLIKAEANFRNGAALEAEDLFRFAALENGFEGRVGPSNSKEEIGTHPNDFGDRVLNEELPLLNKWMTRNKASPELPVEREPPLKNLFYWALVVGGILVAVVFRGFCALLSVRVREKY